jgi:hypothetical protein
MGLVTPKRLRGIYAMLLLFPPFDRWRLPAADKVKFELVPQVTNWAEYLYEDGVYHLFFSSTRLWSLPFLVSTMAHEMCHMRQEQRGKLPADDSLHHNAEFHRIARIVCERLGFPREDF